MPEKYPKGTKRLPVKTEIEINFNNLINPEYKKKFGVQKFIWSDCRDGILYAAAHLLRMETYVQSQIISKFNEAGLNQEKDAKGAFKDPKVKKAWVQLVLDANNHGTSLKGCTVDKNAVVYDGCTYNNTYDYGIDTLNRAVEVAKCIGGGSTIEEILNFTGSGADSGTASCDTNGSSLNAQGAEFPLVTKKGSNIKIYYSQPYPEYIVGGGHNGIDVSPGNNAPGETRVVATFDGTVVKVGTVVSTSCNVTCATKPQRYVILQEDGKPLQTTAIHLSLDPKLAFIEEGKPVKKGFPIGQIDDFMFVHLHYETRLNGVLQNPITQIKGFNQALQASNVRAESSIIDPALYEKL
jgi:hypothetical protein